MLEAVKENAEILTPEQVRKFVDSAFVDDIDRFAFGMKLEDGNVYGSLWQFEPGERTRKEYYDSLFCTLGNTARVIGCGVIGICIYWNLPNSVKCFQIGDVFGIGTPSFD